MQRTIELQKLKGRKSEKTFPLIVASKAMADRYAHPRCLGHRLMKEYWPGPLTLVMDARKRTDLAKSLIKSDGTIAMRLSSYPVAMALSKKLRAPITSTSANVAGAHTSYSIEEVNLAVDYTLDAGKLAKKKPSTIASITTKEVNILRQGSVKPKDSKKK